MSFDIFDIIITTCTTKSNCYDISAWDGSWFLVLLTFIYEFYPFDRPTVAGNGKVWQLKS